MIKSKIVSSLEKALLESKPEDYKTLEQISVLRGERLSFQVFHTYEREAGLTKNIAYATLSASGELAQYATFRDVCNVPIERPTLEKLQKDDDYISKRPGLFPDLLRPLHYQNTVCCTPGLLMSVWVELDLPTDIAAGEYEITVKLETEGLDATENNLKIEIVDAVLPSDDIYLTQWFHCDCLASYYNVETWSERHWKIVENFAHIAAKNGINMLLTPVFTPPLDTAIGGERPTTQLVGVTRTNNSYTFDFTLLDRWIEMCNRIGIKYFEISHLFTQWGAYHAPKVMATVDGEYRKLFGWETEATSAEYREFLRCFLKEFLSHMKKRNDDKRCFFHISDEPHLDQLENYKAAKQSIADLLEGYPIMDALSNYDFWQQGLVKTPIPANNHITPFLENEVPDLWTYYCCAQGEKVSNRFITMTSYRNRSIGFQMYKYNIIGFLHWGYNFYYNYRSGDLINPYLQQDGDGWIPAGDAFSVYPAPNGEALESLRIIVFYEALQDIKAMKLCEKLCGKDVVVKIIDETIGTNVTFDTCAKSADQILLLREKINQLIKQNV